MNPKRVHLYRSVSQLYRLYRSLLKLYRLCREVLNKILHVNLQGRGTALYMYYIGAEKDPFWIIQKRR